jgi:hypothetical protein
MRWAWTFDFLAPHLGLIFRVAEALWDLKVLVGCEIDALMLASCGRFTTLGIETHRAAPLLDSR